MLPMRWRPRIVRVAVPFRRRTGCIWCAWIIEVAKVATGLKFRKAEPADLPRLHEIRVAAFTPIHDGFREQIGEAMFQNQYHDWNQKQGAHLDEACADPNHQIYVVLDGDGIAGFIGFSFD